MKHFFAALLASCLLAGCVSAPIRTASTAPASPKPVAPARAMPPIAARIGAFIAQPRFAHADWGISVVSLDSGKTLYAHDAHKLFAPASNAKLYTAALALSSLGEVRFGTTLYATAATGPSGALDGDLILYGGGDPSLGQAQASPDWADQLAVALANQGVHRVRGDLVADATYFKGPPFGSGWEAGDLQTWYAAPATALDVQENVARVRVTRANGRCCAVAIEPGNTGLRVVNLTHDEGSDLDTLTIYRPPGSDVVYASGSLRATAWARTFAVSVNDPARFAGNLLRDALSKHGIALDGQVRTLYWPHGDAELVHQAGLRVIGQVPSPPLSDLVQHMLKDSDNLYAQVLLQQIGAHAAYSGTCADRAEPPTTSEGWGLCALRQMLARAGIPDGSALFEEGSGLSRKDLVTPTATTTLLAWIANQPFANAFENALPIAGVDGTLEHRLVATPAANNLHAKTGTLTHVYALSGYVTDAAGEHLAFSLMLDHYQRPTDPLGRNIPPSPTADLDAIATMLAGM
jgi:D-alanyl-D-alanine carboxypeptidase/D-alanyl-D-alanine-endopeptidase (penicillin-binding protein 4)